MLRLDINLVLTIINLLVLYFLLRKFLINPVRNVMAKRRELIENSLKEADTAKAEALELKKSYEEQMASAKEDAARIIATSKDKANEEYSKKMSETANDVARMKREAEEAMQLEAESAKRQMQQEIASLAMAAAVKVIGESNTEIQNKALYDSFLQEAGEK
ncbi:MAG: F0F1 ATP synthase subunit B [Eubacterium sp.]|nr:F0F1 ATP synthase subunit B [Eubacterium sp.]